MEGQEAALVQEVTVRLGAVDTVDQGALHRHHQLGPQEPQGLLHQGP